MTDSPNIGLPLMEAAQAQKHVTHNEALIFLDAILQVAVSNIAATAPPSSPTAGMRVVVGLSATGAFVGQSGKIAYFDYADWRFFSPRNGWVVWSTLDAALFIYTGGTWTKLTDLFGTIQNLDRLGVATIADAANPLSVRAGNALFTSRYAADGGDGSLRFKLNKENASASVSQLYQTNWSGRAETGLMGNDLWSVRRSTDGVTWTTPLAIDTTQVQILDGSLTAPGIAFSAATGTGLARAADGSFCASVGGVEAWRAATTGVFSISSAAVVGDNTGARGKLTIGVGLSQGLYFGNLGSMGAQADGQVVMRNNAATGFDRLMFGGTTSSFPAIKRNGAALRAQLADDSRTADIEAATVIAESIVASGDRSAPGWATSGVRFRGVPGTLTDTTSTGTVPAAYTNVYGANTIAASNAVTFTNYFTTFINPPIQGANVTFSARWALGLGGALNIAVGAQTSSQPSIDATQDWNNAGVTFSGWRLNITDSASAAASSLAEFQVGGVRRFAFRKDGALLLGSAGGGLSDGSGGTVNIVDASGPVYAFGNTNLSLISRGLSFGASLGSQDLFLSRKAAATLQVGAADAPAPVAQRIGAQSVVAGTSNTAGANLVIAGSQGTGTGAGGSVAIQVAPAGASGSAQNPLAAGLVVNADRSVSVPTNMTIGDNNGTLGRLTIGIGLTPGLYFGNRGSVGAHNDGVFVMRNNATTGFDRLSFGGVSSAFPSIKRNGSALQARLADDSAFAGIECSFLRPASFTVATVPSASALGAGATIYVSNESGGATPAFSDGAAWRRVTDRAIIS